MTILLLQQPAVPAVYVSFSERVTTAYTVFDGDNAVVSSIKQHKTHMFLRLYNNGVNDCVEVKYSFQ